MRALWRMLAIMLLLVAVCAGLSVMLFHRIDELRAAATDVGASVGSEEREEAMARFDACWNRWRETLSLFIPHLEIDEVTRKASHLRFTIKEGDGEELEEAIEELLFALEGLRREESASLPNIL